MRRPRTGVMALAGLGALSLVLSGCPAKPRATEVSKAPAQPTQASAPPVEAKPATLEAPAEPQGGWKPYRVAATLLTRKHQFYQDLEAALKETGATYKVTVDTQSAEFQSARQRDQVQDFIVAKYDAIIVCPADSDSVGGAIRLANDAHIPVFTADIAANQGDVVCHIASDNVEGGRLAGERLAKLLDGKGDVIIIDHPTVTSVQDRTRGFAETIAKYPEMHVVDRPAAEGQRVKAQQKTQTALLANPGLKAIFGINDDSALGALAALRQAKREDIVIVGYDATPEACKEILAGSSLKADVVQHPREIGRLTIEAVVTYLNGGTVPPKVPVPVGIVDQESLKKEAGA
jgi:ribose transport system substrate-binding protein